MKLFALFSLIVLLTGCSAMPVSNTKAEKTVWLDSWWNHDRARIGREHRDAARKTPGFGDISIPFGPSDISVTAFENDLETAFATNPVCSGIIFTRIATTEHHWQLMLDMDDDSGRAAWSLGHTANPSVRVWPDQMLVTSEEITPEKMALQVCRVMTHKGADIN